MTELFAGDFAAFMREVHGRQPFPWQQALVDRILTDGRWPDVLDVPTGLGKTSVIDVAVFVAAARPDVARRRMFFVVDRRLIVDEAHEHADRLAAALGNPTGEVSKRVAEALRQPGDDVALQVTRMRGGVTWSWRWLERPDRFAVIVGTVDQVGSRLLFRGYGVGEHLRSIDAALVGTDSLIVIDEAHLAQPFHKTLTAARRLEPAEQGPLLVTMSATTPAAPEAVVHCISKADEQDDVAGCRLRARRRLHLLSPPVTKKNAGAAISATMATWAQVLAYPGDSGRVVGVICNTVARARAVFNEIPAREVDRVLLTGRIRPIDRDYLLHTWYDRIRAGRERTPGRPLILVATQTIEVGANIDLDGLVTESAALSALIQRLGRLDRLGQLDVAHALIVHDSTIGDDDPVYGSAREATWSWLSSLTEPINPKAAPDKELLQPGVIASPLALRHLLDAVPAKQKMTMRPPSAYVPELSADTFDAWARTSPAPCPDPPVAPYLHGLGRGEPDVSIVWRSGLPQDLSEWNLALQAVPPGSEEALEAPLGAVRRWLSRHEETVISDVEGQPDHEDLPPTGTQVAVRYAGPGQPVTPLSPDDVHPGDTIVVRAEFGGCDRFGWNPASTEPVIDVADLASRRDRPILRVRPELRVTVACYHPDMTRALDRLLSMATNDEEDPPTARDLRKALPAVTDADLPLLRNLDRLSKGSTATSYPGPSGRPMIVLVARGGGHRGDEGALGSSAGAGRRIELQAHQRAVAARAAEFARNLNLSAALADAVSVAAAWHDNGKQDPRFQAMLYQSPLRALGDAPLLAKSGMDPADRTAFQRAQRIAGYPASMRHEALSARIAQALIREHNDLIVHLIASHHGRGRPLLPPVHDPAPQRVSIGVDGAQTELMTDVTIDWDAPTRFAHLNRIYGRWGLALLEAIVRLADIWCSEREEELTE